MVSCGKLKRKLANDVQKDSTAKIDPSRVCLRFKTDAVVSGKIKSPPGLVLQYVREFYRHSIVQCLLNGIVYSCFDMSALLTCL